MFEQNQKLVFATQGDANSFHYVAAELAAGGLDFGIEPCENFAQVVAKSRAEFPGLGVIAVHNTLSGVVDDSAKQLVRFRPSEVPPIVGRKDVGITLGLMGSSYQELEALNRPGVVCLGQPPALGQCRDFMAQNLPNVRLVESVESTLAIRQMVKANSIDVIAIGPTFAANALGAVLLRPDQINPVGYETSFYVLQGDPERVLLPPPPSDYERVTVISVAFPDDPGEKEKVLEVAAELDLGLVRVIDFASGDFTRDAHLRKRGGGIFDIAVGPHRERRYDFCKLVARLKSNYNNQPGPFSAKPLGSYYWPAELVA